MVLREGVSYDEVRREDMASAAAASNLVDFFQSAAQRWQTPALTGSATSSGSTFPVRPQLAAASIRHAATLIFS